MNATVIPWTHKEAPTESGIKDLYKQEGLEPYRWSNGPGDVYDAHSHPYHKVIYVVRGSIQFGLPESGDIVTLHAGDRLELPPGVAHDAVVGDTGVVCLEAHR
jgi:quercetin dioxygenase-like cupin family protein